MEQCPKGSYADLVGLICLVCPPHCASCLSEDECVEVFAASQNTCDYGCSEGFYPDPATGKCSKCDHACATCYGPSNWECLECNTKAGYMRSNKNSDICLSLSCPPGTFSYFEVPSIIHCLPCDSPCETCYASGPSACLSCRENFIWADSSQTGESNCVLPPSGIAIGPNGKLTEVCGDGLNLGVNECDDGNLESGDGCSSECRIEAGFECTRQTNGTDVCRVKGNFIAQLKVEEGNVLKVVFNREANVTGKGLFKEIVKALEKYMKVTLKISPQFSVDLDWNFTEDYTRTAERKYVRMTPEVGYNLKGRVETFYVTFLQPQLIKDYYQNPLTTAVVSGPAVRNVVIPAAVEGAGTAFDIANYVALVVTLLLAGKSNPAFWVFLGTLQMISYAPLLHCTVPENFKLFIREYFGVSKVSIPFEMLPGWMPNFMAFATHFEVDPGNARAVEFGYVSACFLYNFAAQLITWATVLLLYLAFCVLAKLRIKTL